MTSDRVVFTFWEPRGEMSPYLRLCRRTWETNLPGYEFVDLDYTNVEVFVDEGVYDWSVVRSLSLPMQKDALMIPVLEKNGGIFMDADTLAFQDISPLIEKLQDSEIVMFGMHLAFLAARPGAQVLALWREGMQEKLRRLAAEGIPVTGLRWDFIGNSVLTEVLGHIVDNSDFPESIRARAMGWSARVANDLKQGRGFRGSRLARGLDRVDKGLSNRRQKLLFATTHRALLVMLDPRRGGYIAERSHYRSRRVDARRRYQRFWFEDDLDVNTVTEISPLIVGLHNSWTPDWYKRLSEDEVLENHCLLSKTIRHILIPD